MMGSAYTYVPPVDTTETQHQNTQVLAINNTRLRRFLTLLALRTTARFHSRAGVCVPISKHLIVKSGQWVHLTEAVTMRYIAENTSLPVPKIYCSFVHKNRAYIVMERIRGKGITQVLRKLSDESQQNVFRQLKLMFEELRALVPAEETGVESCVGGSLHDSRISHCRPRFGPFKTIQGFHKWLRLDLELSHIPGQKVDQDLEPSQNRSNLDDQEWQDIKDMIVKQNGPWPAPVFTHGDLNPSNILVRKDNVVGIIDWEFSGWYPYYWEYTSAWYGNLTRTGWRDLLDQFLIPYPAELNMEITRQKWWGEL